MFVWSTAIPLNDWRCCLAVFSFVILMIPLNGDDRRCCGDCAKIDDDKTKASNTRGKINLFMESSLNKVNGVKWENIHYTRSATENQPVKIEFARLRGLPCAEAGYPETADVNFFGPLRRAVFFEDFASISFDDKIHHFAGDDDLFDDLLPGEQFGDFRVGQGGLFQRNGVTIGGDRDF